MLRWPSSVCSMAPNPPWICVCVCERKINFPSAQLHRDIFPLLRLYLSRRQNFDANTKETDWTTLSAEIFTQPFALQKLAQISTHLSDLSIGGVQGSEHKELCHKKKRDLKAVFSYCAVYTVKYSFLKCNDIHFRLLLSHDITTGIHNNSVDLCFISAAAGCWNTVWILTSADVYRVEL